MDVVLDLADDYVLNSFYPTSWDASDPVRQYLSLFIIVTVSGYFLYLATAGIGYFLFFDKRLLKHPMILPNQVRQEIAYACWSIPLMSFMSCFIFLLEVRGYSKLYDNINDSPYGWKAIVFSVCTFLLFTDSLIYWIHRLLHHRLIYKYIHKPHHRWKVPTSFASHAFHPVDGFLQACPYHIYIFLFPLHKWTYMVMFLFVNVWTVSIHDAFYSVPEPLKPVVNGAAHHSDHHLFYNYNYGQFFTFWDRVAGSFREPMAFRGKGVHVDLNRFESQQYPKEDAAVNREWCDPDKKNSSMINNSSTNGFNNSKLD